MSSTILVTIIALATVTNVFSSPIIVIPWESQESSILEQTENLFEGDIMIPSKARSLVMSGSGVRWTNGIVPYEISSNYSTADQTAIINAMRQLENSVAINNVRCIQFRPREAADVYYIIIISGSGCSSFIGQNTGLTLNRTVSLQTPGCIVSGIIMHELLHTLGFFHEHSRPDRDSYIQIITDNIQSGQLSQFSKYAAESSDTQGTPYDYHSVMHYNKNAFSANGSTTIVPLQPNVKIGQRYFLSSTDIAAVRRFYSCSGIGTTLPTPTITTTVATTPRSIYTSALTSAHPMYTRPGDLTGSAYYYECIDVNVTSPGLYTFETDTNLDTYGSLYQYGFDPTNPITNLMVHRDDSSQMNWNFRFLLSFPYALVVTVVITTYSPNTQGPFTMVVTGPNNVTFMKITPSTSSSPALPRTTTTRRPKSTATTTKTRSTPTKITKTVPTTRATTITSTRTNITTATTRITTRTTTRRTVTNTTTFITTTTTTQKTTTTTVLLILMDVSADLTKNSPTYQRPGGVSSNYYYILRQVDIPDSGNYSIRSSSSFPTLGFLYSDDFDPSDPTLNLIGHGQSDHNGYLQFTVYLQASDRVSKRLVQRRATKSYYLVITTEDAGVTGGLAIIVGRISTIPIVNSNNTTISTTTAKQNNNDSAKIGGIIAGSVIGGVLLLICICCLCMFTIGGSCYCLCGDPFRSNKTYVHGGLHMKNEIGDVIFRSGTFSGYCFRGGVWHGSEHFTLDFYRDENQTVFGKGTDDKGTFIITGTFSLETLRMAFDKHYQSGLAYDTQNLDLTSTIQVEYKPMAQNFEGKCYSKIGNQHQQEKYIIQMRSPNYDLLGINVYQNYDKSLN